MKIKKQIIYLDNNATTPIDERVLEAMMPYLTDNFANANSTHQFGVDVYEAIKIARKEVAELIGAESNEIIFTSGATESINLAIKGVAESYLSKGKHIVTVSTEHSAVLDTCKHLETKGYEITYLPVRTDGLVEIKKLKEALRQDTILVSVMLVNNETGVIQPIREISAYAHEVGAFFMTDATQAVGKIPVIVDDFNIDLLCISGHKLYAPKGIGALYVRHRLNRVRLSPQTHGGGHEKGFRSGTLNVPGIVALGKACKIAKNEMRKNHNKILKLRDLLESKLLKIEGARINGNAAQRLYNVCTIRFDGIDSDALIMGLSELNSNSPLIAVSNGSACTSNSIEPSHVLLAMGLSENEAFSSLRLSLGKQNSEEEIKIVVDSIVRNINQLRELKL